MTFQDFGRLQRREGVKGGAVCFGDTGVTVEFVAGRFAAGESLDELAKDYNTDRRSIDAGMRLVIASAFGQRGLPVRIVRAMEDRIPLLPPASRGRLTKGSR